MHSGSSDDSFLARSAKVPADVLVQQLSDGESIILNLASEQYYGLDEVGAHMWAAVTDSPTLGDALEALLGEYQVGPDVLRADLRALVERLAERGLLDLE